MIRRVSAAERDTLVSVLVRAFDADPVANYLLRQDAKRARAFELAFGTLVDHLILPEGEAYLAGDADGVALWCPPDRWEVGLGRTLPMVPSLARAVGLSRALKMARAMAVVQDRHPKEPHWYLFAIGVDPERQGRGIGGALLAHLLEREDVRAAPAYLEASTEGSSRLYERYGFQTTEVLHMAHDAPPLWLMWRPAR